MKKTLIIAGIVAGGALGVAAPAQAQAKEDSCSAYAYLMTDTTICDLFPGNKDRNCEQLKGKISVINKGTDPWKLDRDRDGVGCEGQPLRVDDPGTQPADPQNGSNAGTGEAGKAKDKLPVTGPGMPLIVGGSAVLIGAAGVGIVAYRRKVKFVA